MCVECCCVLVVGVQEHGIEIQKEDHDNPLLVRYFYIKVQGVKRSAEQQESSAVTGATELRASGRRALTDVVAEVVSPRDASPNDIKSEKPEAHSELVLLKNKLRLACELCQCIQHSVVERRTPS